MKWISVNERLPVMDQPMMGNEASKRLPFTDGVNIYWGFVEKVKFSGDIIWSEEDDTTIENVTHFIELELP